VAEITSSASSISGGRRQIEPGVDDIEARAFQGRGMAVASLRDWGSTAAVLCWIADHQRHALLAEAGGGDKRTGSR